MLELHIYSSLMTINDEDGKTSEEAEEEVRHLYLLHLPCACDREGDPSRREFWEAARMGDVETEFEARLAS